MYLIFNCPCPTWLEFYTVQTSTTHIYTYCTRESFLFKIFFIKSLSILFHLFNERNYTLMFHPDNRVSIAFLKK